MRVSLSLLRRYRPELPAAAEVIGELLDDVGIEVKRLHDTPAGGAATLELLANRGDHHCYVGIARELGGRLAAATLLPPVATLHAGDSDDIVIETTHCLAFGLARCTLADAAAALPDEMAEALRLNDEYTGLLAADVGNFVCREIGQPLHVFDADKLVGTLRVRLSKKGETADLLGIDQPVPIPAGLPVVADDLGIVAVAGVIGGRRTAVSAATRHLAIESALYDPVAIRQAARALRRQTAAATRFERGGDPDLVETGAARAVALLAELSALAWDSPNTWAQVRLPPDARTAAREIDLDLDQLDAYYAFVFDRAEVERRLQCLGFSALEAGPRVLRVGVPRHRLWDVTHRECLYEEIGRAWGYDGFPAALPPADDIAGPSPQQAARIRIEQALLGYGFFEVVTDGFYGRASHERLGLPPDAPHSRHLELRNAIDKGYSLLKNNALLQALDIADLNQRYGLGCAKYFEFTHLFEPADDTGHRERSVLWGMLWGEEESGAWQRGRQSYDFWYLKGMLEELAHACGTPLAFEPPAVDAPPMVQLMHPNRVAVLSVGGQPVGLCGEVHPAVTARWTLRTDRVLYFELDWPALVAAAGVTAPDEDLPEHPPLKRDLCLHLPVGLTAAEVEAEMTAASPLALAWVRVTNLFERDGVRAHTFELAFENDNTLTTEQANATMAAATAHVLACFAERGVYQR